MSKTNLTILAVDDDMINLKLLKSMLKKSGIVKEVIEAVNGSDAIDVLKSRDDVDVILLDIIMPIMGGIEMLKIVRADTNMPQLPIIVLTTDETKKYEALEIGANEFVTKPIRSETLISKIESVLV